jgi:DNA repair protein RadC
MTTTKPIRDILDSESFGDERRNYFLDIKKAKNNTHYLRITRSDTLEEEHTYKRSSIILFEDDLNFFIEALTMVLGRFSSGNMPVKN